MINPLQKLKGVMLYGVTKITCKKLEGFILYHEYKMKLREFINPSGMRFVKVTYFYEKLRLHVIPRIQHEAMIIY